MSAFCEDECIWDTYYSAPATSGVQDALRLRLKVFEWYEDPISIPQELNLESVDDLISRDEDATCKLRIVSGPLNPNSETELAALQQLFRHYSFPSAVLSEISASVTYSFGTTPANLGSEVSLAWCQFLCEDIRRRSDDDEVNMRGFHVGWTTFLTLLHVRQEHEKQKCVTLLCFGTPRRILERFRRLLRNPNWRDAIVDPYILLLIVYEELHNKVDELSWRLADIFRPVESNALALARTNDAVDHVDIDFTDIHNISKHCIYMIEAVEASMLTLDDMVSHLTRTRPPLDPTITALMYRKSIFKATQLRLGSLEKRVVNIISLCFNLVTQQDSRVMRNDSNAMKVIAVMTLLFLPATGIASVFSMPFFIVDFEGPGGGQMIHAAASFWVFWVVAIPLTAFIVAAWYWIAREGTQERDRRVKTHQRWLQRFKKGDISDIELR